MEITKLEHNKTYKYLGIITNGINYTINKERIREEHYSRITRITRTELNIKNKVIAINTLAILVVMYSFNIINWTLAEK